MGLTHRKYCSLYWGPLVKIVPSDLKQIWPHIRPQCSRDCTVIGAKMYIYATFTNRSKVPCCTPWHVPWLSWKWSVCSLCSSVLQLLIGQLCSEREHQCSLTISYKVLFDCCGPEVHLSIPQWTRNGSNGSILITWCVIMTAGQTLGNQ